MAKVILEPIGEDIHTAPSDDMQERDALLDARREELRMGWGQKYIDRQHKRGKRTSWERIQALADPDTPIRPVLSFVNWGETFGEEERTSPSAGVITAFVQVHGKWVVAIANDNTVASGSWWPRTPEKIIRAQNMALQLRIPVVYLVDCSGLFLPEQSRTFSGQGQAGHIFAMNSRLSAAGVPQIAGVFGDCIAGGGYMPLISDRVYMTEQAYMVIAGAALIQGAKSQNLSSLGIGGADVHVHLSNCADDRVPDDDTAIAYIRRDVNHLPSSAVPYYRRDAESSPPKFDPIEIGDIVPVTGSAPYDIHQVIARLVDDSLFYEVLEDVGKEVVTGVARIGGLYVGIAANEQGLTDHPHQPGHKRPGGILYREGVAKLAAFSRACNDDGIPIIWLADISGFDIGVEAEKQGLLGYGSSLIYTNSTNQTPMITVLLRKASGAGYYAMAGLPYDPLIQLSTPVTRLSVMEGKTLAIGAYNSRLDDNFEIIADTEEERQRIQHGMKAVEARIEGDMDPYKSAALMNTDEIVKLNELRGYLETIVEMTYQTHGYRRVKNPRIWSLHDLDILRRVRL